MATSSRTAVPLQCRSEKRGGGGSEFWAPGNCVRGVGRLEAFVRAVQVPVSLYGAQLDENGLRSERGFLTVVKGGGGV